VVLKDYFHISTQELYNTIIVIKKVTKKQVEEKRKTKAKISLYKIDNKEKVEEED